ncbi:MAG: hypothetical protein H6658_07040 [Ardenticatenaceae bacterium]|nr:hypothetical protein [Ardenticatenaceae bacterium]
MQIIHPNHPLCGQCRPVLRVAGVGGQDELCWVIEDEALGRLAIPQSWTRVIEEGSKAGSVPCATSRGDLPLVDGQGLRCLARLVSRLQTREKEIAYDTRDEAVADGERPSMAAVDGCSTNSRHPRTSPPTVSIRTEPPRPKRGATERGGGER